MELLSFLGRNGYLPHGYCFTWSPGVLWSMVAADAAIAVAYFSIPLGILVFVRKRPDARFHGVALLFSAFIFACGITHVMDIWTIWNPDYGLQAMTKVVTALISVATAIAVWRMIPAALNIPHVDDLRRAILALEKEVGQRRSAEQHVADVEQSLALTLASIDAGLITTDAAGNVVRMNEVAERITGWNQAQAAGFSYWDVFAYLDRPDYGIGKNVVQVIAERGYTVETSHRVIALARDGGRTSVEVNAALTIDDHGEVRGVLAVVKDMTRVDRAEEDAIRLAAIVESSSDAIIGKTLDGRITNWNRSAARLFGYTAEEALGRSVRMLIPPDRLDEEMRILADIFEGKPVAAFDTVRLAKGERPVDVSVTISPIRDAGGNIVGGSKIARDITQRRKTQAALTESEARLRFALEVAQVGDWDLDLKSGNIHRSIRHDRCFGYERLQPEWSIGTFLAHVHPDERDDVALSYRKALLQDIDWDVQCRVVWPDGSLHSIRIQGSTRYETGNPDRMLGIVSDLTDQNAAEATRLLTQRLESENRQIQEANRLKSQFLANMSHELRSPMNAIIGFSDLLYLEDPPIEKAKQHQYIGHIRTSGRHLLQLINDVLDLSKVESGKFEFFPEPVDLPAVINEVATVLFTQIQRKRLQVDVSIAPAFHRVNIDSARLKQTLYNYLSNAIKFTAEHGWIGVRVLADSPGYFRIEVEDTGIGIAESDLPRLFVEFQQLDASYTKRHQGTGLGLSLTRRMVEAQGGSVGVRSVLGKGSVFYLRLPVAPEASTSGSPEGETDSKVMGVQWLVIEDDLEDQARIAGALAESGYPVDVASSVEQGLVQAGQKDYDAVSLDLMSGSPGGLDILAEIRARGPRNPSAVVGITLDTRTGGTAAFPITDVLAKPLRAEEIVSALRRFGLMHRIDVKVMVIDDDPGALALMRATLDECGVSSVLFLDGGEALRELDDHEPAAIVLDLLMPGFSGFEVLDELLARPRWCDVPVFIWTNMVLSDSEYDLLALSAATILRKGGGGVELLLERLRRWRPIKILPEGHET